MCEKTSVPTVCEVELDRLIAAIFIKSTPAWMSQVNASNPAIFEVERLQSQGVAWEAVFTQLTKHQYESITDSLLNGRESALAEIKRLQESEHKYKMLLATIAASRVQAGDQD